jgi:hypothetical protein
MPEQVQDFYPTPSTISTCIYYSGYDPRTLEKVYVPVNKHEKAMQRALIQYRREENYDLVKEALTIAGRQDLIGDGPKCLIGWRRGMKINHNQNSNKKSRDNKTVKNNNNKDNNAVKNNKNIKDNKSGKQKFEIRTDKHNDIKGKKKAIRNVHKRK